MLYNLELNPIFMNRSLLLFCSVLIILQFSCNGDDEIGETNDAFTVTSIEGNSQKGPYLIGSTVTIFELENDLRATGRSFAEEITDNLGSFKIEKLELASSFVDLRANGFYFNEIKAENSTAQLTLSALSDLREKESINVNILSTLEKRRTEFLINEGHTFAEAKSEALANVLDIFEIDISIEEDSELLDMSKVGDGNAALLAVSAIIQSYGSVADVSELISAISIDIETDGTLDDDAICTKLINNANLLNLTEIRNNLEEWFSSEGNPSAVVPDFEKFVNEFKLKTACEASTSITYPQSGVHGDNILNGANSNFEIGSSSMRAILEPGTSLKIKVYGNNWVYEIGQVETGWTPGDWNATEYSREFTNNREGDIDFKISFVSPLPNGPSSDRVFIEAFENGANTSTWTNSIVLGGIETRVVYDDFGNYGDNILSGNIGANAPMDGSSFSGSLSAEIPEGYYIDVILTGEVWSFPDPIQNQGWVYELLDANTNSYKFTSVQSGSVDFEILLQAPCNGVLSPDLQVEIYEDGSALADYSYTSVIDVFDITDFPPDGSYGMNILVEDFPELNAGAYSMIVYSPREVTVVLKGTGWTLPDPIEGNNWTVSDYDNSSNSQTFYYDGNFDGDLLINLDSPASGQNEIMIDIYEGCVNEPTRSYSVFVE